MTSFKSFEQSAWEAKAHRYRGTWGRVTEQSIPAVLAAARIQPGSRLLDCGAGPGLLCAEATKRGAHAVGCDYSLEMVRLASASYPELEFFHEDAEQLSFADGTFDCVTLNYLLLHVAEPMKVLREAVRVLKPAGRLVYTLWCRPTESPGLGLMFEGIKRYADLTVIPPAGDIFHYSDDDASRSVMSDLGMNDIHVERIPTYWQVASAEEFFAAIQAGTRMGGLIDLQSAEVKESIRQLIAANIEAFKVSDGYKIPTPSILVSATK